MKLRYIWPLVLGVLNLEVAVGGPTVGEQANEWCASFAQAEQACPHEKISWQEVLPSLAYIPAQVDAWLACAHVGRHIERTLADGMLLDSPVSKPSRDCLAVESFAVSADDGSAASLRLLMPMLCVVTEEARKEGRMKRKEEATGPAWADCMRGVWDSLGHAYEQSVRAEGRQHCRLKPLYAVLTLKKEEEKLAEKWSEMLVALLASGGGEALTYEGYRGVKCKLRGGGQGMEQEMCILTRREGAALILVACTHPEDIKKPASVQDSALSAAILNTVHCRAEDVLMVGCSSPAFSQAMHVGRQQHAKRMGELVQTMFESLGAVPSPHRTIFAQAAAGSVSLWEAAFSGSSQEGAKQDSGFWCALNADTLVLECSGDAMNSSYLPGVLRYAAQADAASTIFYAETTPIQRLSPSLGKAPGVPSLLDIGRGWAQTLSESEQKEWNAMLNTLEHLGPEFMKLRDALAETGRGLGDDGAILVDAAGALPPLFGGSVNNEVVIPRLAYCAPVLQRDALANGWKMLLDAARAFSASLLGSPQLVDALSFVSNKVEGANAVSHCWYMPVFTQHMIPNVTISDNTFIAGTSSAYNEYLVQAAAPEGRPFQGAVFALNCEPLANMLRGVADSYRSRIPAEEEAEPMSQVQDDSLPMAVSHTEMSTRLERVAEVLEQMASCAEVMASVARHVRGSAVVQENRCVVRTVVQLQTPHNKGKSMRR